MPAIVHEEVPTGSLTPYFQNPRKGNIDAIAESLATNGQYKDLVVNRGTITGRPNEILAGNHTWMAATRLGLDTVGVGWLDVDNDAAARIVAADNRIGDKGEYDNGLLFDLLDGLEGGLQGTGYDDAALDNLYLLLNPDDEDTAPKLAATAVASTTIVFDDEDQLNEWNSFVRWLKRRDVDKDYTNAGRIIDFLNAAGWRQQ